MNTKEAIEFCKSEQYYDYRGTNKEITQKLGNFNRNLDEVVDLLKRGEKFEKMWGKYKKKSPPIMIDNVKNCSKNINDFIKQAKIMRIKAMQDLEQKYFPKGNIEEVVKGITGQMKEGAEIARKEMKTNETKMD